MADLGVDGIGEIDGGSNLRKGDDTTLRREDEHLVLFEVDLEVRHELVWIRGLLLPIDDSIEPGQISGALVVSDHPRITPEYLAAQIERNKPSIVFVDYLTLMRTNRSGASKDWLNVGELSAELKALAEDYQIPIVTASQINRAGAGNQTPGTEHLSYADAVGQDADCVITMVRSSQHLLKGKVAKYRNGEDGQKFNLLFDPGRGVLEEVNDSKAKDIMEADDIANDAD